MNSLNNNIVLSIIIPAYNCGSTILDTLKSLDYSINNFEVIVVNDGSTKPFWNVIKSFVSTHKNHIKYFSKANGNQGSAVNYGFDRSRGRYIKVLDSDDLLDTENFKKYVNFLNTSHSKTDVVISSFTYNNNKTKKKYLHNMLCQKKKEYYTNIHKLRYSSQLMHHQVTVSRKKFCYWVENMVFCDISYIFKILASCKNVLVLPKNFNVYIYNIHNSPNQATALGNLGNKTNDFVNQINIMINEKKKIDKKINRKINKHILLTFLFIIYIIYMTSPKNERKNKIETTINNVNMKFNKKNIKMLFILLGPLLKIVIKTANTFSRKNQVAVFS